MTRSPAVDRTPESRRAAVSSRRGSRRSIVHGAAARAALLRGMDRMAALVRPTLGPVARSVAIARMSTDEPPEVLDDAALIVRRTIQLADPFEDMGAMLVRHAVWRAFETAGDGAATAAVLTQRIVREAATHLAAGAGPVAIRRGIELGLAIARAELRRQARSVEGADQLARVAAASLPGPYLAEMVGEILDSVGPEGAVLIEPAPGSRTEYDYLDGIRWDRGYVSHFLLEDGQTTVQLLEPAVLVTDHVLERADDLVPVLEACLESGSKSLLVIAADVRDAAVSLLVRNRERGVLDGAIAVNAPSYGEQQTKILDDIAALTGARCVQRGLLDQLERVTSADLGRARQAWATGSAFGISGGRGDKAAVRRRMAGARAELRAVGNDEREREQIVERIGRLAGVMAVIRLGAPTRSQRDALRPRLEAAVRSTRAALQHGVVPGGGAGLLGCVPALRALDVGGDEARGVAILARALAEPMRVIAQNGGVDPGPIVEEARRRGPDWTFDAVRREWVDAWSGGILDPLPVVCAALEVSVSAAATATTSEVLVRRRKPPVEIEP